RLKGPEVVTVPEDGKNRLLAALYGPTSSGKTAMAVRIAQRIEDEFGLQVVVISADSRQVYQYMDIGTSKTTDEEMGGIRHEMLDVTEPVRKFELEEYARLARRHISEAFAAGSVPFVVGGTGVYLSAVLGGWDVDKVGAARASLRRDFPRSAASDAYATLRRLNPGHAARVHPNNYEATINALAAVMSADGGSARQRADEGSARQRADEAAGEAATLMLGLDPGARVLDQRVAGTYDRQVQRGLFEEVKSLAARYGLDREFQQRGRDSQNQVLHTHGYREYFEVAAKRGKPVANLTEPDLAEVRSQVIERIQRHTRRQRGWFGKLPGTRMAGSADRAIALVRRQLAAGR
ncbi:MAG: tRNA (adenosine(37)-N6)-dimethylallyltransferase, partial [Streptosporangiaceae bacterium]